MRRRAVSMSGVGPAALLRWLVLAIIAVALALFAAAALVARSSEFNHARSEVHQAARLLEEHALKLMAHVESNLRELAWLIEHAGWEGIGSDPAVAERLREMVDAPETESIWLADADGRVRRTTLYEPAPNLVVDDRDYFRAHLEAGSGLHIGSVILGKISGVPFFPVSRRVEGNSGAFLGVAQISLTPVYFSEFYANLARRSGVVVALTTSSGAVLAQGPLGPAAGAQLPAEFMARLKGRGGGFEANSPSGGAAHIYSYRQVGDLPLFVLTGRRVDAVTADWMRGLAPFAVFALLAVAVLALLGWLAYRRTQAVEAARRELEERVVERTAELARSETRLRAAMDAADVGTWRVDLRTGETVRDASLSRIFGLPALDVAEPQEAYFARIHSDDLDAAQEAWRRALSGDESVDSEFRAEFRIVRPDGAVRWLRNRGRVLRGSEAFGTGASVDITDLKEAEARQRLLMAELDHRVKNVLATTQSICVQSMKPGPETDAVLGRISALAKVHTLLSRGEWAGAGLRTLVEEVLAPYRSAGAGISIDGPPLPLDRRTAQSLTLALHELATNAAKYGALSVPHGRVSIAWRLVEGPRQLRLSWRESDGPAVVPPSRSGFGSRLIERSLEYEVGARAALSFDPAGLRCEFEIPWAGVEESTNVGGSVAAAAAAPAAAAAATLSGKRVLLVEDSHLLAAQLEAALAEEGCIVVGPVATVERALELIRDAPLDAAILDLNLDGRMAFPAAEALKGRGVPILLLTGYEGATVLPPSLRDVPLLGKPALPAAVLVALGGACAAAARR